MRTHGFQRWLTGEVCGTGQMGMEGVGSAPGATELPLNAADAQLLSLLLLSLQLCSSWSRCQGKGFACLTSFSQF